MCIRDREYNTNTNEVADTLYDVSIQVGETMLDVADKVEDTIDDANVSPEKIIELID